MAHHPGTVEFTQGCAAFLPGLTWGHPVGVPEIRRGGMHPGLRCTLGCHRATPLGLRKMRRGGIPFRRSVGDRDRRRDRPAMF